MECGCQFVAIAISAIVAPSGRVSSSIIIASFEPARGLLSMVHVSSLAAAICQGRYWSKPELVGRAVSDA